MDLNERQKCVVSGLFFVTDETHCMSRIREIVTHYGQQDAVTCCQRDSGTSAVFALLSVTTVTLYDLYRAGCDWLDWKAMVFGAVIVQFSREFLKDYIW